MPGNPLNLGLRWLLARLGRLLPVYSGLQRVGDSRVARALLNDDSPRTCRLRCGLLARVRTSSIIGRTLYFCGDYDRKISWLCAASLRQGDVMLDVGAQFGDTALPAALRVGPRGMVHAFEPNPRSAALLNESIEMNRLGNVVVHQVALSDRDETLQMFVPEGAPEGGTLTSRNRERAGTSIDIRTCDAASFLAGIGVSTCRVLKIDVEGHEGVVLRGLMPMLRNAPPPVVIFESEKRRGPFREREEVRLLLESGYRIHQVQKSLVRVRLLEVPAGMESQGTSYDFVAIHSAAPPDVWASLGMPAPA